ncbi:MAG: hypothetical protein KIT31_27840 [Deltaproteobacteria bacterium]|nr:hypothetical protein [Deltaproteobacteria bacterium]
MRNLLAFTLFTVAAAACGGDDELVLATPQQCNPLGGTGCISPWPSALYEVDDAATATGRRLAIPAGALPVNIDKIAIDPAVYNLQDGFSAAAPIVVAFAGGMDPAGLPHFSKIGDSLLPASPTVLIDMSTGELVAHWAELDHAAEGKPDRQALFIRSAAMLKYDTRYAVAIKKSLKAPGGRDLAIPEGFQAILDGTVTSHKLLEKSRGRYEAIFAALAAKGIAKEDLVTAWDFTTRSGDDVRRDLLVARDATMTMVGQNGANLTFDFTETAQNDARIARRVDGTYDAPLFLTNNGSTAPSTKLARGADGKPQAQGMYRAPFTAIVPQCALDSATPVPLMIYGHGLLGASNQVASSGTRHAAAGVCAVVVGTDMRGMSEVDVANVALALNDANNGHAIFDVLVQGMINHVALVQAARGPMAQTLFRKPGGGQLVDPSKFYYYGISQGGIMGTTVCAIDPVIEKCVLQVGAINYSILLERSLDWPTYQTTLFGAYPDELDNIIVLNLMQNQWDRTEPTGVADVILGQGFPGTPRKTVLMQIAIADDEVSNIASEYQARTMNVPVLTPSPYVPFGLETTTQINGSALVIYDFGLGSTIPLTNTPPPDNDVHSNVRNKQATIDMMKRFYETGDVVQTCTAPKGCDCATGGCGTPL